MIAISEFRSAEPETRHIHGPLADVVLLGGGSLLLLLAVRFGLGLGKSESLAATLILANVINHPHFAHSYQIFYRGFRNNVTSSEPGIRSRYLLAGVVVPVLLIGLLGDARVTQYALGL
jgi:hypothetical protein